MNLTFDRLLHKPLCPGLLQLEPVVVIIIKKKCLQPTLFGEDLLTDGPLTVVLVR